MINSNNVKVGENIEVNIEKLVYGTYGLSRYRQMVVFVPCTLPGEKVAVEIVSRKKDYATGRVVKVINPSAHRIIPPCPVYGSCGGCHYQHINYDMQLELKQGILSDLFSRLPDMLPIPPLVSSPDQFNYRNRVSLKVKETNHGYKIGYYQAKTHNLVEIKKCMLLRPELNLAISNISSLLKNKKYLSLKIKELNLHWSLSQAELLVSIHMRRYNIRVIKELVDGLSEFDQKVAGVVVYAPDNRRRVFGNDFNMEKQHVRPEVNLRISDRSFAQVNWAQNNRMAELMLQFAAPKSSDAVLDLYSGIGNFSLSLAKQAKRVLGIEESKQSFKDGVINAIDNELPNCRFRNSKAEKAVEKLADSISRNSADNHDSSDRFDIVVLNPPRAGVAKELLLKIRALGCRKVIYVSCDPSTLARDIKILSSEGFGLSKIQPFDLFPHTYHMETIVELVITDES